MRKLLHDLLVLVYMYLVWELVVGEYLVDEWVEWSCASCERCDYWYD